MENNMTREQRYALLDRIEVLNKVNATLDTATITADSEGVTTNAEVTKPEIAFLCLFSHPDRSCRMIPCWRNTNF